MPSALTKSSTERVEMPWTPAFAGAGSSLLDHRGECLLSHSARLQETREVAAFPELRDAQLDSSRTGLPVPVAIAIALRQPLRALLAMGSAGQPTHLHLHHSMRGKADHLAHHIGIGASLRSISSKA